MLLAGNIYGTRDSTLQFVNCHIYHKIISNYSLNKWKLDNPSIKINGPIPPDTCWISSVNAWNNASSKNNAPDGILALYHDQGLIPVKLIAFD